SRREQDRVALAFGASDLAFELAIEREVASEQPRIAVADAIGFDAANGGSPHARTFCNSQIVFGAEQDGLRFFPPDARGGRLASIPRPRGARHPHQSANSANSFTLASWDLGRHRACTTLDLGCLADVLTNRCFG